MLEFFGVGVDFAFQRVPLHGVRDGGAHGGNIERLIDVVAGAQAQRLAHGIGRLEGGHHHHLDAGINVFQAFEGFDPGHARHANVQHGGINPVCLGQFDCRRAIAGHQDMVIILENDP